MSIAQPPVLASATHQRPRVASAQAHDASAKAARIRRLGLKSAFSLVDQGLTAAVGFGVNLALARWLPARIYGAFAVAFAGYLFVGGFHNVLLLEPLSVLGPARHAHRLGAYFRAQIAAHVVLVGILAVLVVLAGLAVMQLSPANPLGPALAGSGLALPFLLLLWLARRMCYVVQRPATAVMGSTVYSLLVLASFLLAWKLGNVTPCSAFLLVGAASLASSILLLWRLGLRLSRTQAQTALEWTRVLRENWLYGRWLVGSAVLYAATSQLQMVLAAGLLGLSAAGVLRAMQIPSLVITQVITAAGLLALPALSYNFARGETQKLRRRATLVSLTLGGFAIAFVAVCALFAAPIERILYSGKYAAYAPFMAVLALIPAMNGFAAGFSIAMRASQKPQFDLISNIVAAPVGLLSAFLLMRWWGLSGAIVSMVLSFAALSLTTFVCFQLSIPTDANLTGVQPRVSAD
jgi:O-antigen/teichoic acid export membrane protein